MYSSYPYPYPYPYPSYPSNGSFLGASVFGQNYGPQVLSAPAYYTPTNVAGSVSLITTSNNFPHLTSSSTIISYGSLPIFTQPVQPAATFYAQPAYTEQPNCLTNQTSVLYPTYSHQPTYPSSIHTKSILLPPESIVPSPFIGSGWERIIRLNDNDKYSWTGSDGSRYLAYIPSCPSVYKQSSQPLEPSLAPPSSKTMGPHNAKPEYSKDLFSEALEMEPSKKRYLLHALSEGVVVQDSYYGSKSEMIINHATSSLNEEQKSYLCELLRQDLLNAKEKWKASSILSQEARQIMIM
jgi:hypothetical protein